jgi:hypothetical protein
VTNHRQEPRYITGADSDIEHLLLDQGYEYRTDPPTWPDPRPPLVMFDFGSNRKSLTRATAIRATCAGSEITLEPVFDGRLPVPESVAVRLLECLVAVGAPPDRIIARRVELLPAQVRALRNAAGPAGIPIELI